MKGKLIVFEGIDGAGKQTQVEQLVNTLHEKKEKVTVFSSPRYDTPTGQIVKDALHGLYGDFVGLSPYISALPYLVDFAAAKDEILDALKRSVVVCDRYIPSTVAYAAAKLSGEQAQQFIVTIEDIAYERLKMPRPDTIIYLDVPVETARRLIERKSKDQHERNAQYQARVSATYDALAQKEKWSRIDCAPGGIMRSIQDIHEEIARIVHL